MVLIAHFGEQHANRHFGVVFPVDLVGFWNLSQRQ